jgi:hypothetical protein
MKKIAIFCSLFLLVTVGALPAVEIDDDFGRAEKVEGRYFSIYYSKELDISRLEEQLNITAADKILAGKSIGEDFSPEPGMARMVDILYGLVSDMVDMHIYNFKGAIKICRNKGHLNNIFRGFFNKDMESYMLAFYVNENTTIYISGENFRREVLGHEIAHAIINHYFVVSPPVKVQEILSKYVEYQLRKTH